ncbi:Probable ubiquitin-conjugating enzyme E2 25 [Dionaea muscipula]
MPVMMDDDVFEISPSAVFPKSNRAPNKKSVTCKEIIVINDDDEDDGCDDLMIIDEKDFPNACGKEDVDEHPILKKLETFKRFDVVSDHSDHHFTGRRDCLKPPSKGWAKQIQEEWKILEKDLPDSIYVRVYETRLDLLRAVIRGADGTPYHDGIFFFDAFFPSTYPHSPPLVHYHSGGLRLNPNLYECGKVCLSLLNTWSGNSSEMWRPLYSTMLQVLVSIQGLILNSKPYFNEPGYEARMGTLNGERSSYQYTEATFLKSLKTMLYTMRRPPKHFEDLVVGHFFKHAHDIMAACKAYMRGGTLVGTFGEEEKAEGGKEKSSRSSSFAGQLPAHIDPLVREFVKIGVKNCEDYSCAATATGEGSDHGEKKGSGSKATKRKRKTKLIMS